MNKTDEGTVSLPLRELLRFWRKQRNRSQLDLALIAGVSQRHISFIELGRSTPSRTCLLTLAETLDVPLRDRNQLLLAAGYAPLFREVAWNAPEMVAITRAIDRVLQKQEPYPALVLDRYWNVLKCNRAMMRFWGDYIDLERHPKPYNLLRILFAPEGLQPFFVNWKEAASVLFQRVRRDSIGRTDERMSELLAELASYPGAQELISLDRYDAPVIPFTLTRHGVHRSFLVLTTTIGTPSSITAEELRIDTIFPLNDDWTV
ncbi:MAG: helix-turn-helix domain-containing protein [Janthinobacterium lividum]